MTMTEQQRRIKAFLEVIRDERMTHANTATRIGNALIMLLEYFLSTDAPFLRKDMADGTDFLLTLLGGAVIGESKNIRLNPDGSITCGSIFVEGSAIFTELVFNHQNVLEGDTYFTDRGIIENVEFLGDGEYRLYMRKVHDNDTIPFHVNDVLRSAVNNLDTARTYRTTWMRVNSVDTVSRRKYEIRFIEYNLAIFVFCAAFLIRFGLTVGFNFNRSGKRFGYFK